MEKYESKSKFYYLFEVLVRLFVVSRPTAGGSLPSITTNPDRKPDASSMPRISLALSHRVRAVERKYGEGSMLYRNCDSCHTHQRHHWPKLDYES